MMMLMMNIQLHGFELCQNVKSVLIIQHEGSRARASIIDPLSIVISLLSSS